MTSSACQLGELTTLEAANASQGSVALKVLPFEAWQLVEQEEFDLNPSSIAASDDSEHNTQRQRQHQQQQQPVAVGTCGDRFQGTRSGSSDSGQLSLLSSFGSISFGGYQIGSTQSTQQHQNNNTTTTTTTTSTTTNPSSDTASHQSMSVDIDQHQFYCSLMLLNSLDFCHYENQKTKNSNNTSNGTNTANSLRQQQQPPPKVGLASTAPSLTLSQVELRPSSSPTLMSHNHHKGSLQDFRSHWFSCDKATTTSTTTKPDNTSLGHRDSAPVKSKLGDSKNTSKRRSAFGLSILGSGGGNCQSGANLAGGNAGTTTSSTGFVDKLLAHMINRRSSRMNGRTASSMSSVKQNNNKGDSKHLDTTMETTKSGPERKASTKEKCKRQKDAERVEKLRLLVNYLKSGSSQPVVSPVTLEADEIELAERYKMHVISRDDILQDIQANEGQLQLQHQSGHQQHPLDQSVGGSKPSIVASHDGSSKLESAGGLSATVPTISKTNNSSLISHSIGGTSASSPVSSSSTSSMNHAHHSVHDGRSILRIGDVTWVLRHSISDPGNNFEHSPAFSTASSSPPTKDQKHHYLQQQHHHHHHHHHNHHHHRIHLTHDGQDDHHSPKQQQQPTQEQLSHPEEEQLQQHQQQQLQQPQQQQPQLSDLCSSCAPSSSSYSGSSLSNYCLASGSNCNKSGCVSTQQQQQQQPPTSSLNQPSPKMFYIDDMDMIPVFSSNCMLDTTSSSAATQPLAPGPMLLQQQTSTPLTKANSTNCCSQPATPVIYTNLSTSNINNNNNINSTEERACGDSLGPSHRNSSSTSAWTNPQNLATWIDNEVNSLVHDLEAKSQQLQIKNESKHNKSGKKKWLSVTSSHSSRRSSSGAQST